jgi:hypothetical protein
MYNAMKKKTVDLLDYIQFLIFGGFFLYKAFSFMKTDILKALGALMLAWLLIVIIKVIRIKRIIEQIDISIFKKVNPDNHYNKEMIDKLLSCKKIDSITNVLICLEMAFAVVGYVAAIPITPYKYSLLTIILFIIFTFGLKTCFTTKKYLEYLGSAYEGEFSHIISTKLKEIDIFRNLLITSFLGALYITILYIVFNINIFYCFFQYLSFTILVFLSISVFSIYKKLKKIVKSVLNINISQLDIRVSF